jgi:flagellar biosynthesis protein FlhG
MGCALDKSITDQAEGLRRLLAGRTVRLVAVTSGAHGVGCSTTVLNLAAALAALGREVLVIDEHAGASSLTAQTASVCGTPPREGVALRHPLGFSICAATRRVQNESIDALLSDLGDDGTEIVLVDAQCGPQGELSTLARGAHDVLMVTRVAATAITAAYASMKRLHYAHAFAQFRVLINQVRDHGEARHAFDNLAGVASRYMAVSLAPAGCITADPLVNHARELRRIAVDAFPSSPAARDFRRLAADLPYWPLRPSTGGRHTSRPGTQPAARDAVCSA